VPFKLSKPLAITLLLIVISGCASKSSFKLIDPNNPPGLTELNHWQLEARVAIQTPEDSITASLDWQKNNREFNFLISGAFGVTLAHLVQDKRQASLDIPDHDTMIHSDAQVLLQQALGWDFPIDALSYWIKGLPSGTPGEIITRDELGKITSIEMGYWQINITKYRKFQGFDLPKMIKASHPNMSLKVVAKKWAFYQQSK
jgi:outer membrane lipoprotein LolB